MNSLISKHYADLILTNFFFLMSYNTTNVVNSYNYTVHFMINSPWFNISKIVF